MTLTKEELRAKRLAALEGGSRPSSSSTNPSLSPDPKIPQQAKLTSSSSSSFSPNVTEPPKKIQKHNNEHDKRHDETVPQDELNHHNDSSKKSSDNDDLMRDVNGTGAEDEQMDMDPDLTAALKLSMTTSNSPPPTDSPPPADFVRNDYAISDYGGNFGTGGDDELEQALKLSLQTSQQTQQQQFYPPQTSEQGSAFGNFDQSQHPDSSTSTTSFPVQPLQKRSNSIDTSGFEMLMWSSDSTYEDKQRWYSQGIRVGGTHGWGLEQSHGGPCGILVVLQCHLLMALIQKNAIDFNTMSYIGPEGEVNAFLSHAIGKVLARAAFQGLVEREMSPGVRFVGSAGAENHSLSNKNELRFFDVGQSESSEEGLCNACTAFLTCEGDGQQIMQQFIGPGGVILLARSIVETRTVERINSDFDNPAPDCTLTARFGACQGEMLNLCLSGCASSNMFDGVMDLGGMIMKGVPANGCIGHLSHLEALRYFQVGAYYKSPTAPFWIVGSESHYSILFATDDRPITESQSDQILQRCRREFRKVDTDGNGFIQMTSLREVLAGVDLLEKIGGDVNFGKLVNGLEDCGAGIILWESFWKTASRLLTGAGIDSILEDLEGQPPPVIEAEASGGNNDDNTQDGSAKMQAPEFDEDKKVSPQPVTAPATKLEMENLGDTFTLFHFNGLRGGSLTKFSVTRLSAEDAVGASVALSVGGGSGMGNIPLEEVCRTRWPSAKFVWENGTVPSID